MIVLGCRYNLSHVQATATCRAERKTKKIFDHTSLARTVGGPNIWRIKK